MPEKNWGNFRGRSLLHNMSMPEDPAKMPLGSSAQTLQKANEGTTEPLPKHEGGGAGLHHGKRYFVGSILRKSRPNQGKA